jgi:hypothetical protein
MLIVFALLPVGVNNFGEVKKIFFNPLNTSNL